jgi:hypothetical protein
MSISPDNLRKMIAEDEFGLLEIPHKREPLTADERLLASFREIMEFVDEQGREPAIHSSDMSEAKLGMRLKAIIGSDEQRLALLKFDALGLLREPEPPASVAEAVASDTSGLLSGFDDEIFAIRNVPVPTTVPEKIAQRKPCKDFEQFEPLFKRCHAELRSGLRKIVAFRNEQEIRPDTYYVLKGVLVYVAAATDKVKEYGRINARLRCIFENGTEADLLLRSLSSQLYRFGKRVTEPNSDTIKAMGLVPETPMARVYVLRTLSDDPQVEQFTHLYKIGSTKVTVEKRTAHAAKRTTFLNAPVEIVAEYEVPAGVEQKIERMLHRLFADARLDVWFDKQGKTVAEAREWFAVPLKAIDEAIGLIETEAITNYEYDPEAQAMKLRS